jgi:hypothetical protein
MCASSLSQLSGVCLHEAAYHCSVLEEGGVAYLGWPTSTARSRPLSAIEGRGPSIGWGDRRRAGSRGLVSLSRERIKQRVELQRCRCGSRWKEAAKSSNRPLGNANLCRSYDHGPAVRVPLERSALAGLAGRVGSGVSWRRATHLALGRASACPGACSGDPRSGRSYHREPLSADRCAGPRRAARHVPPPVARLEG